MDKKPNTITAQGFEFTKREAVVMCKELIKGICHSLFIATYITIDRDQILAWRLESDEERMFSISELIGELEESGKELCEKDETLLNNLVEYESLGATDVVLAVS
jgi:hypothetical protein